MSTAPGGRSPSAGRAPPSSSTPRSRRRSNGHNACYQGAQGSKTACSSGVVDSGNTLTALSTDLKAHENLTIAIGFASGTFVDVSSDPNNQPDSGTGTPSTPATPRPDRRRGCSRCSASPRCFVGVIGTVVSRVASAREPASGTIIPQYSVARGARRDGRRRADRRRRIPRFPPSWSASR